LISQSRGLGDVYKRQKSYFIITKFLEKAASTMRQLFCLCEFSMLETE
jgi:hypothetical protein